MECPISFGWRLDEVGGCHHLSAQTCPTHMSDSPLTRSAKATQQEDIEGKSQWLRYIQYNLTKRPLSIVGIAGVQMNSSKTLSIILIAGGATTRGRGSRSREQSELIDFKGVIPAPSKSKNPIAFGKTKSGEVMSLFVVVFSLRSQTNLVCR